MTTETKPVRLSEAAIAEIGEMLDRALDQVLARVDARLDARLDELARQRREKGKAQR